MMSFRRFSLCLLAIMMAVFVSAPAALAANTADFRAGRIIDDAVFNNSNAMNLDQVQAFLNARVPQCDNWGTKPFGGTTRRAYLESRGVAFPLTCVKDYVENPITHQNNLEGRPAPAGGMSAAHIIWDAGQRYGINPQVLIVLLQKEQSLIADDWPEPSQYRKATGYFCPDTADCDAQYAGFYNQVQNAARQFKLYANNPNSYNHVPYRNNFVRYNPNSACGGTTVYIENQATASLYNYTPYQPNASALAAGYGRGDDCAAHGNRNFWLYFNDWFGNPLFNDPFGWDVIKLANDDRWFLVVGKTKRWIPSGPIYDDWGLNKKPVRTVSQTEFDSYSLLPELDRLGWFGDRYYYVDGGKRYWLSTDQLQKAWGQYNKKWQASAAFTLLASMPDGGEATFYVAQSSENKVAFLDDGNRYTFPTIDADRWRANPISLTSNAYNAIPNAVDIGYTVSINGLKFVVDNGRLLDVTNPIVQRAFGLSGATFASIPSSVSVFLRSELAMPTVVREGSPHWYRLLGAKKYHIPIMPISRTWGGDQPTTLSARLFDSFTTSSTALSSIVHEPDTDTYYLVNDGTRHKLTGAMRDALQGGSFSFPDVDATSLNDLMVGGDISSPILRNQNQGHVYTMVNGTFYHIPTRDILNAYGSPRRYAPVDVSGNATYSLAPNFVPVNMFLKSGSTTYFMQDGYAFPISSGAVADWTGGGSVITYMSPNFTSRFNTLSSPLTQKINELGRNLVVSNGQAIDVGTYNDAYDNDSPWTGIVAFGLPRAGQGTYLVRSSDSSDVRIWIINKGAKTLLTSGDQLNAYSQGGRVGVTTLSPAALASFSDAASGPSLLTVGTASGFKMVESDGSFYSFPNGDTAQNYMQSNRVEVVSQSIASSINREKSPITRLVRGPDGKVYWVENGQKRWILSNNGLQPYSATPITNISAAIADWLPSGTNIP